MRFKFVPEATTTEIFYLVIVLCVHETDVKVIKFPPRTIKFVCEAHPENLFIRTRREGTARVNGVAGTKQIHSANLNAMVLNF